MRMVVEYLTFRYSLHSSASIFIWPADDIYTRYLLGPFGLELSQCAERVDTEFIRAAEENVQGLW